MAERAGLTIQNGFAYICLPERMTSDDMVQFQFFLMQAEGDARVKEVVWVISSYGGNFQTSLIVLGMLESMLSKPLSTVTWGVGARSSATPLFIAGGKGRRWMHPDTRLMVHQLTISIPDRVSASKLLEISHNLQQMNRRYCNALAWGSNLSAEEWWDVVHRGDIFISPDEALMLGMADHIGVPSHVPLERWKT